MTSAIFNGNIDIIEYFISKKCKYDDYIFIACCHKKHGTKMLNYLLNNTYFSNCKPNFIHVIIAAMTNNINILKMLKTLDFNYMIPSDFIIKFPEYKKYIFDHKIIKYILEYKNTPYFRNLFNNNRINNLLNLGDLTYRSQILAISLLGIK
jgi:hypothetical protein